jgi:hypothetical protein
MLPAKTSGHASTTKVDVGISSPLSTSDEELGSTRETRIIKKKRHHPSASKQQQSQYNYNIKAREEEE